MNQLTNYKHKIDFLLNDASLSQSRQITVKQKPKLVCSECNRKRQIFDESYQVCFNCYKAKSFKPIGNKVIDDFIRYTLISGKKLTGKMEFVPYDRFENVEFIAEGGFSKIYKATWIDGPISG